MSRDFPLESIHPLAFKAAEAAHCAGEQKAFWAMTERLFTHQRALGPRDLPAHAQAVGLDVPTFQSCLASGKYAPRIRQDLADGRKAGVTGTPTFFLGLIQPDGSSVKVLRVLRGSQSYGALKAAIDIALATPHSPTLGGRPASRP